jgi:hypothetical protein
MSEYLEVRAQYKDRDLLIAAVDEVSRQMAFRYEVHLPGEEKHLFGYLGDMRQDTGEIIIRRNHLNEQGASNDMAWTRAEDGTYKLVISRFDQSEGERAQAIAEAVDLQYQENFVRRQISANPAFAGAQIECHRTEAGAVEMRVVNVHVGG